MQVALSCSAWELVLALASVHCCLERLLHYPQRYLHHRHRKLQGLRQPVQTKLLEMNG